MLVSTIVVVWRSRPAAIARAQQRQHELRLKEAAAAAFNKDVESGTASAPLPVGILKKVLTQLSSDSSASDRSHETEGDHEEDEEPSTPELHTPRLPGSVSHSPSTVNVIISPSVPHLFQLAPDGAGGVEVRVTPPTPSQSMAALKGERRVRFETLAGMQGEHHESVWWFI
ncbi:hypothetical protein ONZ51_g10463 [Trametes cubensis]|uniref:Uncharacterized protein n=1 Tax=Trametes cubensis TaxID=1111947 RepID=A0AAD7TM17_9APHY|nr:hypothetical protein ONZ51_g10463 [Trametes cubensis]